MFITFEGLDCAGKTTQSLMLKDALEAAGHKVVLTREPGGTPFADKIRDIVMNEPNISANTALLLYNAARSDHVEKVIKPALAQNMIVICDRFVDSTVAYQGFAMGLGRRLPALVHNFIFDGFAPNLTIVLDLDLQVMQERLALRKERSTYDLMNLDFHAAVKNAFLDIARMASKRCCLFDGNAVPSVLHEKILSATNKVLLNVAEG